MTIDRKELFDLYKMAVEMDRFELDLSWKLVQFFTVLSSGLLTLGFTLLGTEQVSPKYFVAPIFIIGAFISIVAINARKRYHEHSLRAAYKKTLIENELGLYEALQGYEYKKHNLAITTSPKKEPIKEILEDPENYISENILKFGKVPWYQKMIFVTFLIMNGLGIVIILWIQALF
jgi:hypothetical protein